MSTCACIKCGKEYADAGELTVGGFCPGVGAPEVACRDRELANLRSLLRSVTRRLENARECCEGADRMAVEDIARELDAVLDVLS